MKLRAKSRASRRWPVALLLVLSASPFAHADKRAPLPEDVLPQSDLDDPIGVDSESRAVERTAHEAEEKHAAAERAAPLERARFGPEPPMLDVRQGEVMTAWPSVRELSHRVDVKLAPGHAEVAVELSFESKAQKPAELRYRLAVPDGSRLFALEVCDAHACRKGVPVGGAKDAFDAYDAAVLARGAPNPPPIARARSQHDARGAAIVLNAAPLADKRPLRVKLSYACPVAMHAGVLRLTLPARGMDPQAAPADVRLSAPGLLDARIADAPADAAGSSFDPWLEVPLRARLKHDDPVHAEAWQVGCNQRCGIAQVWSGPHAASAFDIVIALDVSPSTEGPARGRQLAAVTSLLATAPEGSKVRALAFGGRARPLIEQPLEPSQVALAPFGQALAESELGSATRFEAVWELARAWLKPRKPGLRPLIVLVGDGGITLGDANPFEKARAAGVEVSSVNAADRASSQALFARVVQSGGIALDVGAEAEAATRGRATTLLDERMLALFAPTTATRVSVSADGKRSELGPLRAGELLSWAGSSRSGISLRYGARTLAARAPDERERGALTGLALTSATETDTLLALDHRDLELGSHDAWPEPSKTHCDRRGPATRPSGISSDAAPVALAEERACKPKPKAAVHADGELEIGKGMPSEPLLSMLRQRILPVARGCFRRDRAGRADYTTRAVFVFTLAEREVVAAKVDGKIPDGLRTCLLAAVDSLEVPRFTGVVNVRYPLVTESVPLPEQIDLKASTAGRLDRLFGLPEKP